MVNPEIVEKIKKLKIKVNEPIAYDKGLSKDFLPWNVDLSPSALYRCSVVCRKQMGHKTPEIKWISVKRWVNITPEGVHLPAGCYLSIKRKESFEALPTPKFVKQDYVLIMLPHGNVWSMIDDDLPLTEDWLWSKVGNKTQFEVLLKKDFEEPIIGYFQECKKYMDDNPDQIGIHLKRKKNLTKIFLFYF